MTLNDGEIHRKDDDDEIDEAGEFEHIDHEQPTEIKVGQSLALTLGGTADNEPASLDRVGRYSIERLLGRGAFGAVYLARDEHLDRRVAIKIAHKNLVSSSTDASIYLEEARHVAKLDHPHIVPVHDVGSTDDIPFFFVSKFIDGETLATTLREERIHHFAAVQITIKIAEALQHAHKHGLVHRDVKPAKTCLIEQVRPI